ncbi:MAG: PHB depolymerase family esterase [Pseudomonadota bacterium]
MPLLFALFVSVLAMSSAAAFETRIMTIEHDGVERRAILDAAPDLRRAPVLVALHGGLAGPRSVRRRASVTLARDGWAVLWPYAISDWNDGRTDFWGEPFDTADDIGFLRRLISSLAERGMVDPERVYFAGPSIGGIMVLRLLCDAPDLVAGAAVAIASFPERFECQSGPARPILFLHGTEDELVPPDGGRIGGWNPLVRERGRVRPVDDTMAVLARRNGCSGFEERALPNSSTSDDSSVRLRRYENCAAPLLHYIVDGGGHTWPGGPSSGLGARIVGATNRDISATKEIEQFFQSLDGG